MRTIKNIVVLGGGTAGWLTALYCQKKLKNADITLIESSSIGILGAGEGTTTHFVGFLQELDIPVEDIIKHAKGTFKNGILFSNWNGDDSSYFHPFLDSCKLTDDDFFIHRSLNNQENIDNLTYSSELSRSFKVKFHSKNNSVEPLDSGYALHFDARLLASYLKSLGVSRGIKLIDAKLESVVGDNQHIKTLVLDNNQKVDTDFIFDCSGFARLLIGKHFQSEWMSYKDSIPNNRAIPFFIENHEDHIPPYTEAIAMKYGWVWKIPVQGRYGCGYVFDSRAVSDEDIKKEIFEKFGEVKIPTVFNFEPGCYKEVFKGNCLAVGLSSGFVEPLEATSIWVSIVTLTEFFENPLLIQNPSLKKRFNRFIYSFNEELLSFIYFHYLTKRTDTVYWKDFQINNCSPELINDWIDLKSNSSFEAFINRLPNTFQRSSILAVGVGIKFFNDMFSKKTLENNQTEYDIKYKKYTELKQNLLEQSLYHSEYIDKIIVDTNT